MKRRAFLRLGRQLGIGVSAATAAGIGSTAEPPRNARCLDKRAELPHAAGRRVPDPLRRLSSIQFAGWNGPRRMVGLQRRAVVQERGNRPSRCQGAAREGDRGSRRETCPSPPCQRGCDLHHHYTFDGEVSLISARVENNHPDESLNVVGFKWTGVSLSATYWVR